MPATLIGRPRVFERGDKVYLTTPITLTSPTSEQVEEFAFASAVKSKAPNDNIGWLQGRYVESERANLNGAMWLSEELAIKSLTPMLMPITVMHDPRTAVGCIADCKFQQEAASARIDNILAVWKHRFPGVWEEAAANIDSGQLMQSMECYTPHYRCSSCDTTFLKLPNGAERASWCEHLRTGDSWRILEEVCFTGTGLIFGSRGGVGAYTEAHLDHFQDEIAEFHDRVHHDSTYRPQRSASHMGLVQIEESELATLRRERDEAKGRADTLANENRDLTTKVETAEAAQRRAEDEKAAVEREKTELEEKAQRTALKDQRIGALGAGFLAKLGDTSKAVLNELAAKASDTDWDVALKEREELAGVKRDATAEAGPPKPPEGESAFRTEEVANFLNGPVARPAGGDAPRNGATSVRQLARALSKPAAKPGS